MKKRNNVVVLTNYLLKNKFLLFFSIVFAFILAFFEVERVVYIEYFVDSLTYDYEVLLLTAIQYFGLGVCLELSEYVYDFCSGKLIGCCVFNIRNDLHEKLNTLPYSFFVQCDKSDIISKFVTDIDKIRDALRIFFDFIVYFGLTFIYIFKIYFRDPTLAFIFILMSIPILISVKLSSKKIVISGLRVQEKLSKLTKYIKGFLDGIKVVKVSTGENDERRKMFNINNKYLKMHVINIKHLASFEILQGMLLIIAAVVIAVYSGKLYFSGLVTIGVFTFIISSVDEVHSSVSEVVECLGKFGTYFGSANRVFNLLFTEEFINENLIHLKNIQGTIEFDNVSFKYDDQHVLKNVSFQIPAKSSLAIVGKSGSGKSTLVSLLLGLLKPTNGKILIDGFNLQDLDIQTYRQQIGLVTQEPIIFDDTLYNNINYGLNYEYSEDEIIKVAQKSNAAEFILPMKNSLHSFVGDGGINLSGGQKQRIAITRVFMRVLSILFLDEATSSLDASNEFQIMNEVQKMSITKVIITHKISNAMCADYIIVLDNGIIIESGTHEKLVNIGGIYYLFYRQQILK